MKYTGPESLYWFLGFAKRMLIDESNKEQTLEEKRESSEVLKAIESAEISILSAPEKLRDMKIPDGAGNETPFAHLPVSAKSWLEAQLQTQTVETLSKELERIKTETGIGSSNLLQYIADEVISYRVDGKWTPHYRAEPSHPWRARNHDFNLDFAMRKMFEKSQYFKTRSDG